MSDQFESQEVPRGSEAEREIIRKAEADGNATFSSDEIRNFLLGRDGVRTREILDYFAHVPEEIILHTLAWLKDNQQAIHIKEHEMN